MFALAGRGPSGPSTTLLALLHLSAGLLAACELRPIRHVMLNHSHLFSTSAHSYLVVRPQSIHQMDTVFTVDRDLFRWSAAAKPSPALNQGSNLQLLRASEKRWLRLTTARFQLLANRPELAAPQDVLASLEYVTAPASQPRVLASSAGAELSQFSLNDGGWVSYLGPRQFAVYGGGLRYTRAGICELVVLLDQLWICVQAGTRDFLWYPAAKLPDVADWRDVERLSAELDHAELEEAEATRAAVRRPKRLSRLPRLFRRLHSLLGSFSQLARVVLASSPTGDGRDSSAEHWPATWAGCSAPTVRSQAGHEQQ